MIHGPQLPTGKSLRVAIASTLHPLPPHYTTCACSSPPRHSQTQCRALPTAVPRTLSPPIRSPTQPASIAFRAHSRSHAHLSSRATHPAPPTQPASSLCSGVWRQRWTMRGTSRPLPNHDPHHHLIIHHQHDHDHDHDRHRCRCRRRTSPPRIPARPRWRPLDRGHSRHWSAARAQPWTTRTRRRLAVRTIIPGPL